MDDKRISKLLSLVLRHKPETIGIELNANGWVEIDTLLPAMARHGKSVSRQQLADVVANNDKQRFVIAGNKIRANQGHSVAVDLGLTSCEPPNELYHGTATRFVDSIFESGLLKKNRHHVHLSGDLETTSKVDIRHGKLALLAVDAAAMAKDGHVFYLSKNGVWLVDHVPPKYLRRGAA